MFTGRGANKYVQHSKYKHIIKGTQKKGTHDHDITRWKKGSSRKKYKNSE